MAGKTWGPFTGAQLTIMFVAAMAVALPGTLWAVAASSVSITDIANGHTAAVSSARRLFVSSLDEGTPTPAAFFHDFLYFNSGSGCLAITVPPSGKAAVVTDIRLDFDQNPSPGFGSYVAVFSDPGCQGNWIGIVHPTTLGQYVIPFGPGFATKTAIFVRANGSVQAIALVDGYRVPASQVPGS